MRVALLVLLTITVTLALQCWNNGVLKLDSGKEKQVKQKIDCQDGEEYCLKTWTFDDNNKTVPHRQCGDGLCASEYCSDETNTCCCKGNYCNTATSSSLLVTSLLVGTAAWLRL